MGRLGIVVCLGPELTSGLAKIRRVQNNFVETKCKGRKFDSI